MNSPSSWQPDKTPKSGPAGDHCVAGCKPVACTCPKVETLDQLSVWLTDRLELLVSDYSEWETNRSIRLFLGR